MSARAISEGTSFGLTFWDSKDSNRTKIAKLAIDASNVLSHIPQIRGYVGAGRFAISAVSYCFAPLSHREFILDQMVRSAIELTAIETPSLSFILFAIDVIATTNRHVYEFLPRLS